MKAICPRLKVEGRELLSQEAQEEIGQVEILESQIRCPLAPVTVLSI